jgi:DMSO/TMAO reductase YedYZ molybdopterin-dependent catalytic subunit
MPEFIGVPEAGQWRSKPGVRPIGSLITQPAYQHPTSRRQLDAVHSNVYDGRRRYPSFVTLGPILLNYQSDMETDPKYQPGDSPVPESHPENVIISPDMHRAERISPGQTRTRKWPVLHATDVPSVPLDRWKLNIGGLVENCLSFTWDEFQALPRVKVFADFHCVTTWSRLGNLWEGVSLAEIVKRAGVKPEAKFVVATGYDYGWTTNLPLNDLLAEDVLIADIHDGEPIDPDHGGPARLMVPQLYAWKSAKWLLATDFLAEDRPGYWGKGGYHNHGDPWIEERYGW